VVSFARRTDANHAAIVDAMRRVGFVVLDLSRVGGGIPDLWVYKAGRAVWVEIKDGSKPPSKQRLTKAQEAFHALCRSGGVEIVTVTSVEQAIRL
jgi:hypothetical protein